MKSAKTFDDRAMIEDSVRWPCWPYLPVKRGNNSLEDKNLGILYHSAVWSDGKVHVIHGYMFSLPESYDEFRKLPETVYDSIEAMLVDGWIVD